jgi:hypothetical protein
MRESRLETRLLGLPKSRLVARSISRTRGIHRRKVCTEPWCKETELDSLPVDGRKFSADSLHGGLGVDLAPMHATCHQNLITRPRAPGHSDSDAARFLGRVNLT